jgi:glycosyltransferase involved in cell wall biosynthesis
MKPYFSFGLYQGCNYVRLWLPMKYNGWVGDYKTLEERRDPKDATQLMLQSDIVVMHRPFEVQRIEIAGIIKKMGKALVVDNDDTYKDPIGVKGKLKEYAENIDKRIESFIRNADLVTCSTEFLKEEYQRINKNVYVLPNCIDPDDWPAPQEYQNEKIRVGIVGSVAYDDFKICKGDLEKLSKEKDIQIVLFAFHSESDEDLKGWMNINYEFNPYVRIDVSQI